MTTFPVCKYSFWGRGLIYKGVAKILNNHQIKGVSKSAREKIGEEFSEEAFSIFKITSCRLMNCGKHTSAIFLSSLQIMPCFSTSLTFQNWPKICKVLNQIIWKSDSKVYYPRKFLYHVTSAVKFSYCFFLTLSWRRSLSYRNQSFDSRSKSMDWFLYDNGLRHERVNKS